ncbi:F-box/kelch-repeat protein At3g23880-like [Cornus florida]|uniref:F-box/kelch-repeat protein At3g23880-like n=1 Tax=Cornus florida TaxID=4283 RepID=UPI00289E2DF3|nr:F-box/kelch-repeat protein At3g23880-like [Cornus florida]
MVIANGVLHLVVFQRYLSSDSSSHSSSNSSHSDSDSDDVTSSESESSDYSVTLSSDEYEHDPATPYVIVYFDMVDEKFKEMPPPNCINEGDMFHLTVMRGCLSLYCTTIDGDQVDVWTMKQYGDQNSWTKLFVIPHGPEIRDLDFLMPLCATKKGEVVMSNDDEGIIIYNPRKNKCRSLELSKLWDSSVVLYLDSLVLPI